MLSGGLSGREPSPYENTTSSCIYATFRHAKTHENNFENIFEKNLKKVLTNEKGFAIITKSSASDNKNGSIAQLGEHLPYKQRVIGSSPIVSTIWPGSSVG